MHLVEKNAYSAQKPHQKICHSFRNGGSSKSRSICIKKNNIRLLPFVELLEINYQNLTENQVLENLIIIQMYTHMEQVPNVEEQLVFPFENITENHLVVDLIYNIRFLKTLPKKAQNH